jgi:hypothetical protein
MSNRIVNVPLTTDALVQIETALRLRAAALHGISDDMPAPYAKRHYREAGNSYSRLAQFFAEYAKGVES